MEDINFNNYFWQDGVIRLRAVQPEDWESIITIVLIHLLEGYLIIKLNCLQQKLKL